MEIVGLSLFSAGASALGFFLGRSPKWNGVVTSSNNTLAICGLSLISVGGIIYFNPKLFALLKKKLVSKSKTDKLPEPISIKTFTDSFHNTILPWYVSEVKTVHGMPDAAVKYVERMLNYNVPGGKLTRGLTVVNTTAMILGRNLIASNGELDRICSVGWGIELLQASFLVADDIMDSSVTRRGQPCWYKNPDIGLAAVNDALVLLTQIDVLLMNQFSKDRDTLEKIRNLFTKTAFQTELGQLLDLTTQPINGPVDLNFFTMSRYKKIVEYKTAYYSFYAPVALGLILAGITSDSEFEHARLVCAKLGEYFQIQDDYLDCYGDPKVIGKIGTDIQDSKCSWLIVQALARASADQKKIIEANYGKKDEKCISVIKKIYQDLQIESAYMQYEEEVAAELLALINKPRPGSEVPSQVYSVLLDKIYKRSK